MRAKIFFIIANIFLLNCDWCGDCCDCCLESLYPEGEVEVQDGKKLQDSIDNILNIIKSYKKVQNTLLCGSSIFEETINIEKYEDVKSKIGNMFNGIGSDNLDFSGFNDVEKKAIGSMLGMAIGDIYGSAFEFKEVDRNLFHPVNYNKKFGSDIGKWKDDKNRSGWTDDASMGLCIADSLILNKGVFKPLDIMNRFLAWWYCGYNNASMHQKKKLKSWGLGGNIGSSFNAYLKKPVKYTVAGDEYTSGNGSIMRNAAIPIAYHKNLDKALEYAKKQSKITHKGHEAAGCCKLLTYIVWSILNMDVKDTLKDILNSLLTVENIDKLNLCTNSVKELALSKEKVESDRDKGSYENWNWKNQNFSYNEKRISNYTGSYAMDNMAMALHTLYYTTSFEQAINVVVHMGGDADSVASVVGQIAGAFYGVDKIPVEYIKCLYKFDHGDFTKKALLLVDL